MKGRQVSRIAPDGSVSVFANTGGGPNGSNFGPDGHLYVCNNGGFPGPDKEPGRIERIAPDGSIEVLIREVDGQPLNSPNDLGFDEHGNFYFTDPIWRTAPDDTPPGSIYFHDTEGTTHRLHTGFGFPNGIGVSPDGKTLIVCESLTYKLHAFDIHEPGVLGEPREFGDLGDGAHPDGFAFDAEILFLATRLGYRIGELPVPWFDSLPSRVDAIRHSVQMLKDVLRVRLLAASGAYETVSSTTPHREPEEMPRSDAK